MDEHLTVEDEMRRVQFEASLIAALTPFIGEEISPETLAKVQAEAVDTLMRLHFTGLASSN